MIEALQNAMKHGAGDTSVSIERNDTRCVITTTNRILNGDREKVTKRLTEINTLDESDVKSRYLETLSSPATGENGGLGLLFMRRKSGAPLGFNFEEIDTLHSYFYLRISLIIF